MNQINKNIEMIIGYDLSECRYDEECYIVDKLKSVITDVDVSIYSFIKEDIEVIYSKDLYKILLEEKSEHISEFVYGEVLPQIEQIGSYFSDDVIDKIINTCCMLPEEELSDDYINDGSLSDAMDLYNKATRVKKRTKKWREWNNKKL